MFPNVCFLKRNPLLRNRLGHRIVRADQIGVVDEHLAVRSPGEAQRKRGVQELKKAIYIFVVFLRNYILFGTEFKVFI